MPRQPLLVRRCSSAYHASQNHCQCGLCNICTPHLCPTCVLLGTASSSHRSSDITERTCPTCRSCAAHCECPLCHTCGQTGRQTCPITSTVCHSCCGCYVCGQCGTHRTQSTLDNNPTVFCTRCNRCTDTCCPCDSYIQFINNPLRYHEPPTNDTTVSKRLVGIEFEIAGARKTQPINEVVRTWSASVVHDGSLPSDGFEINTAPAGGTKLIDEIHAFTDAFAKANARITSSCGTHIHVDARDLSALHIRNLLVFWTTHQDLIFRLVPQSRAGNSYCIPFTSDAFPILRNPKTAPAHADVLLPHAYYNVAIQRVEDHVRALATQKYNDTRYRALNIHSYFYRKTVENRLHQGTISFDEIAPWCLFWASVLDRAKAITERELHEIIADPSIDTLLAPCNDTAVRDAIRARLRAA